MSYRDPNLSNTLDVYDAAGDAVIAAAEQMKSNPEMLSQAIIGTIGEMDGSLGPDMKGFTAFQRWLVNENPETRQRFRDQVIDTKPKDFAEFGRRLKEMKEPSIAVVSSPAGFEAAEKDEIKALLNETSYIKYLPLLIRQGEKLILIVYLILTWIRIWLGNFTLNPSRFLEAELHTRVELAFSGTNPSERPDPDPAQTPGDPKQLERY